MKKWRPKFQKVIAAMAAAILLAGSAEYCTVLSVQAQEADGDEREAETTEGTGQTGADDASVLPAEPEFSDGEEELTQELLLTFDELPDNDELIEGYIERLFYGEANTGISTYGIVGDKRLTDKNEKKIYTELKEAVKQIAAGTRTNTIITVSGLELTLQTWGDSSKKAVSYLMMDCPYDLYWFNKSSGGGYQIQCQYNKCTEKVSAITFSFSVAKEYQGGSATETNAGLTSAATKAAARAKGIVTAHAAEPDREKLTSYMQEICNLTDYNYDALEPGTAYGNPWQLVWVFDGDAATKVVCEGYSKAFQYLCDLSAFGAGTECYTVTGKMNGGGHMWNIVTLNGKNYLADVTNSDSGTIGFQGGLFLALPSGGTVDSGYTFTAGNQSISYVYDSGDISLLGREILSLPGTNETDKGTARPEESPSTQPEDPDTKNQAPKAAALSLNGQKLKDNAVLKVTFKKKYAFKASVTDAEGRDITGSSNVTWSSSNKKVATVSPSGKVTVKKKAGIVTITASTDNGKTARIKLKAGKGIVKASKVKITAESKTMNLKTRKTQTLKAVVSPASAANRKVTWKSSNKKIATVNSKGKVTAKKAGTVKITATAKDGSKKKAVIKIKIRKK